MQSDKVVERFNYAMVWGAYVLALAITLGFFWAFLSLVGWWAFGLLFAMAAVITMLKIFIVWFL